MTDERLNVSLDELERAWSIHDMLDAHIALDYRDLLIAKARER